MRNLWIAVLFALLGVASVSAGETTESAEAAAPPVAETESAQVCELESGEKVADESVSSTVGDFDAQTARKGCKPCKGRRWCGCTYNGLPRISCDPCCYSNGWGLPVCLD